MPTSASVRLRHLLPAPPRGFATLLLVAAVVGAGACRPSRSPVIYEFPPGYRGWLHVEYGNPACPPLASREGAWLLKFSSDGVTCTSSAPEEGWAKDEFYFAGQLRVPAPVTNWGGGGLIWDRGLGLCEAPGVPAVRFATFFVGTEAEFLAAGDPPLPAACPH